MTSIDEDPAPAGSYAELVSALFKTLPTTLIMTALFCGTGMLAYNRTQDALLMALLVAGSIVSALRIAVVMHGRGLRGSEMSAREAAALERRFAIPYLAFALILGLFTLRLAMVNQAALPIVAAVLVSGYTAGVSVGVYVRPWICVPAILLGVVPLIGYAAISAIDITRFVALLLAAFAVAGIESAISRYRSEVAGITQRLKLASFTRQDDLTVLPNQLALLEEAEIRLSNRETSWIHLVEVDGLAAVNRRFGHAEGDAVIRTLASRLAAAVGNRGFLSRISGGQFAILQGQVHSSTEISHLIEHVAAALRQSIKAGGEALLLPSYIASTQALPAWNATDLLIAAQLAERQPVSG